MSLKDMACAAGSIHHRHSLIAYFLEGAIANMVYNRPVRVDRASRSEGETSAMCNGVPCLRKSDRSGGPRVMVVVFWGYPCLPARGQCLMRERRLVFSNYLGSDHELIYRTSRTLNLGGLGPNNA
jgi:hypothetical protein